MRIDPLQVYRSLGTQRLGIQVDPEKRASFLNKFLRESWHVADRETDGNLDGMVSKHRESTYRRGRFRHWIKIKNREPPAFSRVQDQFG